MDNDSKVTSQNHDKIMDINNGNITTDDIAIIILSSRANFEQRMAIREAWAGNLSNPLVFIVGNNSCYLPDSYHEQYSCLKNVSGPVDKKELDRQWLRMNSITSRIQQENETYKDMISAPNVDTYRNLPSKLKHAYDWVMKYTKAKWILKVDDDMYVQGRNLHQLVENHSHSNLTVIGCMRNNTQVYRTGKWAESDYKPQVYPMTAVGSCGHIVSRDIAGYISKNRDALFEYQGEDTSLGIWMNQAPFSSTIHFVNSTRMSRGRKCLVYGKVVIGHDFTPLELKRCQRAQDKMVKIVIEYRKNQKAKTGKDL